MKKMNLLSGIACLTLFQLAFPAGAEIINVTSIPSQGWLADPDNTSTSSANFQFDIPTPTPVMGAAGLSLSAAAQTERALLTNYASFPDFGTYLWGSLSGSFSTYIPDSGSAGWAPALKFPSFQDTGLTNFTTLNIEPYLQPGGVTPGTWQTWTITDSTMVWQSRPYGDVTCIQSSPCTFATLKALHPNGHFFGVQLGVGSGVAPAPTLGFADAVHIVAAGVDYTWDFDSPPAAPPAGNGGLQITTTSSRADNLLNLLIQTTPVTSGSNDEGSWFIFIHLPESNPFAPDSFWYMDSGFAWHPFIDCKKTPAVFMGSLSDLSTFNLSLPQVDIPVFIGTEIYIGYGKESRSSPSGTACNSMLASKQFTKVFTLAEM